MQEGDLTHDEINGAIAQADKTIVFARQNRLRDGVLLGDDKLPRFHAGHDNVRFFYSAVRQLPEYLLDALLARDISVTLVVGRGLLAFRDVRCWCAVHTGRTRRTVYLPERILEVAHSNGYDYWSIAHILVTQGWKLLDFVLLYDMVEAVRQQALESGVTVVGYSTFRRLLRQRNRHRSSYESPELMDWREKAGMGDAPINEIEAFTRLYEPRFVHALSSILGSGGDGISAIGALSLGMDSDDAQDQLLELRSENAETLSSDAVAKLLWDERREEEWAQQKSDELFKEQEFPDFFLLDRDILHPAAKEMAEAAGQLTEPQSMAEARHDYRDGMRFGLTPGLVRERFLDLTPTFGVDGVIGLLEEIVSPLFETGAYDENLAEAGREVGVNASRRGDYYVYFQRGVELLRLRDALEMWRAVRVGERDIRPDDMDVLKQVATHIATAKAGVGDNRRAMAIAEISRIHDLLAMPQSPPNAAPVFRGLLVGEAHRMFDENLDIDERTPDIPSKRSVFEHFVARLDAPVADIPIQPAVTVWQLLDEQVEIAVARAMLSLDLAENYEASIAELVQRGAISRGAVAAFVEELEQLAADGHSVADRGMILAVAKRSLMGGDVEGIDPALADIVPRVRRLLKRVPERFHVHTSGKASPLRKALLKVEEVHKRHPTSPEQLGYLAMALVRLDRHEDYDELLAEVRAMGEHAVGEVLWRRPEWQRPKRTPGLLMLADEGRDFEEQALTLAEEISGRSRDELLTPRLVLVGD